MTASHCPPRWFGDDCDIPICARGRTDFHSKTCICPSNYEQPFCLSCSPGFWGSTCSNVALLPEPEPSLLSSLLTPLLPICAVIFTILIFVTAYYGTKGVIHNHFCRATKRDSDSSKPPSYEYRPPPIEPPPPYSLVMTADDTPIKQLPYPKINTNFSITID